MLSRVTPGHWATPNTSPVHIPSAHPIYFCWTDSVVSCSSVRLPCCLASILFLSPSVPSYRALCLLVFFLFFLSPPHCAGRHLCFPFVVFVSFIYLLLFWFTCLLYLSFLIIIFPWFPYLFTDFSLSFPKSCVPVIRF